MYNFAPDPAILMAALGTGVVMKCMGNYGGDNCYFKSVMLQE